MKTVYIGCNLFDGYSDSTIRENTAIWVEDGIITAVTDGAENTQDWKVVDLKGKYVMPGLINAHCHLFGTGQPSKILGGGGLQKAVVKFTKTKLGHKVLDMLVASSAKTELLSGVTTLRSMGDFCYSDVRVRDRVKTGKLIGPRMLVSGPAITVSGGHGDGTFAIIADTEDGLRALVQENAAHKVDIIKICVTGGVMDAKKRGEPGEVKMNLAQTKAVVDEAHKLGYKVASHTESPQGVEITIDAGVDTIEHGTSLTPQMAQKLKDNGGMLVPTFSPALPLCRLTPDITKMSELCIVNGEVVVQEMIDGAKDSIKYGLNVGCGTDASCPFSTQYGMWREAWYFAKLVGVSNAFALSAATLGNAKVLGLEEITGTVEAGKSADFIVASSNPLDDIAALRTLDMVVSQGKEYDNPSPKKSEYVDNIIDKMCADL